MPLKEEFAKARDIYPEKEDRRIEGFAAYPLPFQTDFFADPVTKPIDLIAQDHPERQKQIR